MGNSTLPTVLDKLCVVANINTRKLIEIIKAEIKTKEEKIQELQEMIDSLGAQNKRSRSTPRRFNEFQPPKPTFTIVCAHFSLSHLYCLTVPAPVATNPGLIVLPHLEHIFGSSDIADILQNKVNKH